MAGKTVDDLRALRDELIVRRRTEAYSLAALGTMGDVASLTRVHLAIEALDQVIKEGEEEPETERVPGFDRKL